MLGERNMCIHCVAGFIVIAMGFFFKINPIEWCILLILIGNVFSKEAQNSAIEDVVDLNCKELNSKARDSKDKAAAGVLIAATFAVIVGGIIFVPKIMALYV